MKPAHPHARSNQDADRKSAAGTDRLERAIRSYYRSVEEEPVPQRFVDLIETLRQEEQAGPPRS